jgi:hypothetical protein
MGWAIVWATFSQTHLVTLLRRFWAKASDVKVVEASNQGDQICL